MSNDDVNAVAKRLQDHALSLATDLGAKVEKSVVAKLREAANAEAAKVVGLPGGPQREQAEARARAAFGSVVEQMVAAAGPGGGGKFSEPLLTDAEFRDAEFPLPGPAPEPGKKHGLESIKTASLFAGSFVTLAAALLTFSVVFANNFRPQNAEPATVNPWLYLTWVGFAAAIVSALTCISRIIGFLDNYDRNPDFQASVFAPAVRRPALYMVVFFGIGSVGLALAMIFAPCQRTGQQLSSVCKALASITG
jgi:hypothetical protein